MLIKAVQGEQTCDRQTLVGSGGAAQEANRKVFDEPASSLRHNKAAHLQRRGAKTGPSSTTRNVSSLSRQCCQSNSGPPFVQFEVRREKTEFVRAMTFWNSSLK